MATEMRTTILLATFLIGCFLSAAGRGQLPPLSAGKAELVVLVVWDGMRPDFISPEHTPTLYQLSQDGVFFRNHHAVYISTTEVNGTALATGAYPDHSGLIANKEYRPELNWLEASATESVDTIRKGDWMTGGHYLSVPTMAEVLHEAGFRTAVAGTKPVALLQDRFNRRGTPAGDQSVMVYGGHGIPSTVLGPIIETIGRAFPTNSALNDPRNRWTAKALTQTLWRNGVPKLSVLWLSEPDASQHAKSPGSAVAVASLTGPDRILASVLAALEEKGVRQKTDVMVVSDHGFSTIVRGVDLAAVLKNARFKAARKLDDPEPGEILVDGLGGSVMLYVIGHDEAITRRLVKFLQSSDFAGVIFSRLALPGTFRLQQAHINSSRTQPDVVMSMRWWNRTNDFGTPGTIIGENGKARTGTHGSLSRYDMHNTLVAAGPDFRRGFVDELPTGNIDVAPTVLSILGIRPPASMDGRVLAEAFTGAGPATVQPQLRTIEATADLAEEQWRQYLKFTTFGDEVYYEEGNGGTVAKK
jgi:arylsulfatase A-like enzyme